MWKIFSKAIFHITIDEISLFPTKKREGGGGLNRWTVILSVISPSLLPDSSPFRTKGEALSPLIFFREIKYLFKMLSFLKITGYIQKFFLLFFVLLRSGNSTWASLTRERYFQHSKIKFVSPRGHVISSIYALILVKKLTNNCESNCLSTHICDPPRDFRE